MKADCQTPFYTRQSRDNMLSEAGFLANRAECDLMRGGAKQGATLRGKGMKADCQTPFYTRQSRGQQAV
ncbi:hypothetical protein PFLUV_G00239180 [Perca fluviatilis]|uniref:Uncharacterized protein n=1 Tax=Perca fluviatilis TaxID=8168 RepID=A0A6A5E4M9_PERFL|nr:hypothetical protein PFLUV_G00239180 [Perca fluviatilis]